MPRGDFDDVTHVVLETHGTTECIGTVDLHLPNGRRFCRLTVAAFLDGSFGAVDVNLEDGQVAQPATYVNGEPHLFPRAEGARLIEIKISQGPIIKTGPKAKRENAYAAV